MKKILFSALTVLFFISTTFSQEKDQKVDSLMGSYYGKKTPGIGLAIIKDNQVVAKKVYGYANLEENQKAGIQTNYNLGTLSEQFVIISALMLKEDGKLDISSLLSDHISGLPDYCSKVKVVNLLEHNSGLPTISPYKATKKIKNINDLKNFLNKRESLQFRPGRSASWNVLNFYLLAYIVNDKLKSSFRKYISKNIFDPLGMENSVVFKKSWFFKVPNKAIGYRRARENEFQKNELKNDNYIPGTNGIYSNLDDMVKWMNVWKTDTLLSKKTIGQINRINFVRGQKEFLGYGWKRSFNKGKKYFYSGGINQGNTHLLLRFPSAGIDIVILSNQSSLFNLRKNAFRLLNLFADKKYEVK